MPRHVSAACNIKVSPCVVPQTVRVRGGLIHLAAARKPLLEVAPRIVSQQAWGSSKMQYKYFFLQHRFVLENPFFLQK